jgi:hypothetical protein
VNDGGDTTSLDRRRAMTDAPTARSADFAQLLDLKLLQDKYVDPDRIGERPSMRPPSTACWDAQRRGTFYVDPVTVPTGTGPSGSFEGIGGSVDPERPIVIVAPIKHAAARSILPGDVVLGGLRVDGAGRPDRGAKSAAKGTTVTLKILHPGGTEETLGSTGRDRGAERHPAAAGRCAERTAPAAGSPTSATSTSASSRNRRRINSRRRSRTSLTAARRA